MLVSHFCLPYSDCPCLQIHLISFKSVFSKDKIVMRNDFLFRNTIMQLQENIIDSLICWIHQNPKYNWQFDSKCNDYTDKQKTTPLSLVFLEIYTQFFEMKLRKKDICYKLQQKPNLRLQKLPLSLSLNLSELFNLSATATNKTLYCKALQTPFEKRRVLQWINTHQLETFPSIRWWTFPLWFPLLYY